MQEKIEDAPAISSALPHDALVTAEQDGYAKTGDRLAKHRSKIQERKAVQTGRAGAAAQIAEGIRGVMLILQKSLDAEMISMDQARAQRDMLERCRGMAAQISQAAQREIVLLDGEDRGLLVAVTATQALAREALAAAARAALDSKEDEEYRNGRDEVAASGGDAGGDGSGEGIGLGFREYSSDDVLGQESKPSTEHRATVPISAPDLSPEPAPTPEPDTTPATEVVTSTPPPIVIPLRGGRRRRSA